jgi:hypothetical protein
MMLSLEWVCVMVCPPVTELIVQGSHSKSVSLSVPRSTCRSKVRD